MPAFDRPVAAVTVPAPSVPADEITTLKAELRNLQERFDHVAPISDGKTDCQVDRPTSLAQFPSELPDFLGLLDDLSSLQIPHTEGNASAWPLSASWKDGLQIESKDTAFRVHVGGTLQFDYGWNAASQTVQFGPGGIGELQDGGVMRRAQIRIDGTIYDHIEWVAEYDFANTIENDNGTSTQTIGTPSFVNAWIGVNDIPLAGTVRVGFNAAGSARYPLPDRRRKTAD